MFVQSETFVESHGGRIGDIAIYGQESNNTTWRLAKMNLAVRGIDADIRWNNEGSFVRDELRDLRFDYILANPPFNISDLGRRASARGWALDVRRATSRQCELCVAATHPMASGTRRDGGGGVGERLHVLGPERGGYDPPCHGRSRRSGLYGRIAGAIVLLDADTGLPLVSCAKEEPGWAARSPRRGAVH
jgi:hypothetical protein